MASETKDTVHGQLKNFLILKISQNDTNTMQGYFAFVRTGFDYFIDNRNTVTFRLRMQPEILM